MTATHAEQLLDHEAITNDAPYTHKTWEIGDVAHQGDLIFVAIEDVPKGAVARKNRQLADGDTQGSRHILEGGECFDCDRDGVAKLIKLATKQDVQARYIGPIFTVPCTVTHPEHGDHIWVASAGAKAVAVVFQRSLDAEEREMRVLD